MKLVIDLTDEEIEVCKMFFEHQQEGSPDNCCTRYPTIHVVERPIRIPTTSDYADGSVFKVETKYDDDKFFDTFDDVKKFLKEMALNEMECADDDHPFYYPDELESLDEDDIDFCSITNDKLGDLHRVLDVSIEREYFCISFRPVAFFLIRKKAQDYMKYQSHNLAKGSRIYTYYGPGYGGNGDLIEVASILSKIGKAGK